MDYLISREPDVYDEPEDWDDMLLALAKAEGYSNPIELIGDVMMEVKSPGICTVCGETFTNVDCDQRDGYCDNCGARCIKGVLALANLT